METDTKFVRDEDIELLLERPHLYLGKTGILLELGQNIKELRDILRRINMHVIPGETDSIDSLRRIIRHHDRGLAENLKLKDEVSRLRETLKHVQRDIISSATDTVWTHDIASMTSVERIQTALGIE